MQRSLPGCRICPLERGLALSCAPQRLMNNPLLLIAEH
jgi:hypothetical protein